MTSIVLRIWLMVMMLGAGRSMSMSMSVSSADKVELNLYYETLCPYSAAFIVNDLDPIFKNGLIDIVDLKLFPWGNAKLKSNNSFTCQHGPNECLLNTVQACAIHAYPSLSQHFPFISCVENLALHNKYTQWNTCFDLLALNPKPVLDCYPNELGIQLELKYAAQTGALQPPHQYVPWVVLNGMPLYQDYRNFTAYVCKAYKGSPPSVCRGVSSHISPTLETIPSRPVSYAANLQFAM